MKTRSRRRTTGGNQDTELFEAAAGGNVDRLRQLLDAGADVNTSLSNGITLLAMASFTGKDKIVELLLEKGAQIDKASQTGNTPLYAASFMGNVQIVKLLLEHNAAITDLIRNDMYKFDSDIQQLLLQNTGELEIPIGAQNAITLEDIQNGNNLVNFHDEKKFRRYYKTETFESLMSTSGQNPATRQPIKRSNITHYKAKIVGGRRKTRRVNKEKDLESMIKFIVEFKKRVQTKEKSGYTKAQLDVIKTADELHWLLSEDSIIDNYYEMKRSILKLKSDGKSAFPKGGRVARLFV